ncbi:MAG TPA: hypothetical protein VN688_07110 [Gemmataceae bacterium]|nr:hypothetical protein [Gemmataceae bacterium]
MIARKNSLPPVILLDGGCNALSAARSLGRAGIKVYALNAPNAHVRYSRYCTLLRPPGGEREVSARCEYLLSPDFRSFHGAVLLACSDAEIEFITQNREQLAQNYRLDLSEPTAQLAMLNKLDTYEKAVAAGVPVPRFWVPKTREQFEALRGDLEFPVVVKPLYSHVYRKQFASNLVVAWDFEEAFKAFEVARAAGIEVMLVEMIPGPDDRLCSYYTYLDADGSPLFHFTKRVIRRSPPVFGVGCHHVTDWNPEVRDVALRFFQAVGLRGLANAEFKYDERDGRLKLIECNARFTAANCLVMDSGIDLPLLVYNRIVGRPQSLPTTYRTGLHLWYPLEDFHAFRCLRRQGSLTLCGWLASLVHRHRLPYFRWSDPLPSLVVELRRLKQAMKSRLHRLGRALLHRGQRPPQISAPPGIRAQTVNRIEDKNIAVASTRGAI